MIPDPLSFVLDAVALEGALWERSGDVAHALVPGEAARRLGVPEECRFAASSAPAEGGLACGLGAPLLEKLVAEARARVPAAHVRLDLEPPRPGHARTAAERFVLRNGLVELGDVMIGPARYVAASLAYVAEADDRHEGLVRLVLHAGDGGEPDAPLAELLDLTYPGDRVAPAPRPLSAGDPTRWLAPRAERAVMHAAAPFVEESRRRQARDHQRIVTYFAELAAEASSARRRVDENALRTKLDKLSAERDAKLRALPERFAVRVSWAPAALVAAEVPAAAIAVRIRRRKAERSMFLRLPALARAVDRVTCDACGGATSRPAACDDRLHLLCESCAPSAQGRFSCPACAVE